MTTSCLRTTVSALAALLSFAAAPLSAQTYDTELNPAVERGAYATGDDEPFAPEGDAGLFAAPAWAATDPFRLFSKYRFGAVRYRERGLDDRHFRVTVGGVDLSDN
ncbi:MAG: hypothetical protein LBU97_00765, partial [Alistipes sp.]|nr:hypothetical protein [Alistipes sp.]